MPNELVVHFIQIDVDTHIAVMIDANPTKHVTLATTFYASPDLMHSL